MDKVFKPIVIGIIERNGKYLFTQRAESGVEDEALDADTIGIWQTPGGTLEFAEGYEECLRRELLEEVGIEVEVLGLLPKLFSDIRTNTHLVVISYLCRMKNPHSEIVINEEASAYKWLSIEEVKNYRTFPKTIEGLTLAEELIKKL